jgi:hypothetical protein
MVRNRREKNEGRRARSDQAYGVPCEPKRVKIRGNKREKA